MPAISVRIFPSLLCLTFACAACAPSTDESSHDLRGGAGSFGSAGTQPLAAGVSAPPLTTAGVTGVAVGVAGSGVVAGSGAPGSAGRPPFAGVGAGGAGAGGFAGSRSFGGSGGAAGTLTGAAGVAGSSAGAAGAAGAMMGGPCGSGTSPSDGRPTTGPLACIVEEHNAVRAKVMTMMPLAPVTWSADLAKYAQEWTDMTCMSPMHRSNPTLNGQRLGENLYASSGLGPTMAGKEAVDGWAGEVACYTYGTFMRADKCDMTCTSNMHSDGCGHYTQVVWRASTQIGCGVTTCGSGFAQQTEVICNYAPAGNYIGMNPY